MSSERYRFTYDESSVYGNVVRLVQSYAHKSAQVVLDIGSGYGAIAEPLRESGFTYVGLDINADGMHDLSERGFETYQLNLELLDSIAATLEAALGGRSLVAITALDVIEHLTIGPRVVATLREFSSRHGSAPLVVSIPNVAHIDLAAKLLLGRWDVTPMGLLDETHVSLYSPSRLREVFAAAGWLEVAAEDFHLVESDQHFPKLSPALRPGAPLHEFLLNIRSRSAPGATVNQFVRAFVPKLEAQAGGTEDDDRSSPFLSVIWPTELREIGTIEDTLVCLDAQSIQEFELFVICLTEKVEAIAELRRLVDSFAGLATRTSILSCSESTRASAINIGLQNTSGRYVAFLEDDTVLFANWIEEFATMADFEPGTVVRAIGAVQASAKTTWPGSRSGYAAIEAPRTPWPATFDVIEHLRHDCSPVGSYAIPRGCFEETGLYCDESLGSEAEREVFLQAALLSGLRESGSVVTSLRRVWSDSTGLASSAEQVSAFRRRLGASPILLPPGSLESIEQALEVSESLQEEAVSLPPINLGFQDQQVASPAVSEHPHQESARLVQQIAELSAELGGLRSSTSWRVTAPLRRATPYLRRLRNQLHR